MNDKSGLYACLAGFVLLLITPFAGGFGWIARLLGFIGVANGAAKYESVWFRAVHWIAVAAVVLFALIEICTLTGLYALSAAALSRINLIVTLPLVECLLIGLRK